MRSIKELISINELSHLRYIPLIILKIKNWYSFLQNYLGLKNNVNLYNLRNGVKIKINEIIDTTTIAVVFIKKDYGNLKKNSIVIDIGANIGVLSLYAAASKCAKIYSYEPMLASFKLLTQNIKLNNFENTIIPFNLGIASRKEKRKLFLSSSSPFHSICSEDSRSSIDIDCITLADVFSSNNIKHCDILKIDCEGAEFEILYSSTIECFNLIKEIRLEFHEQEEENYNIKSLKMFLENKGFATTFFKRYNSTTGNAWFERKN